MVSNSLSSRRQIMPRPSVCKSKPPEEPPPPDVPYPPNIIYKHYDWDVWWLTTHVVGVGVILCDNRTTWGPTAYRWTPTAPKPANGWWGTWLHNYVTALAHSYIEYRVNNVILFNGNFDKSILDKPTNIDTGWYTYDNPLWKPRRYGRDSASSSVPPAPP